MMSRANTDDFSPKEMELLSHFRNILLKTGKSPSVRQLQMQMGYRSPRSISVLIESLSEKGILSRHADGRLSLKQDIDVQANHAVTIEVPLIGQVACGMPIFAEEHFQAMIPISRMIAKPPHRYFLLHARGDSMNEAGIQDGDLVLVRHASSANPGELVVALIDTEATIKKLRVAERHVILEPCSSNPIHQPIILERDFQIQGVVVDVIPFVVKTMN